MAAKPQKSVPRSNSHYEQLGRAVEHTLADDYMNLLGNTRHQIWSAFVRGIFMGLGTVIGATLVLSVLLWVLHLLGGLPVVGHYLQGAGNTLQGK